MRNVSNKLEYYECLQCDEIITSNMTYIQY